MRSGINTKALSTFPSSWRSFFGNNNDRYEPLRTLSRALSRALSRTLLRTLSRALSRTLLRTLSRTLSRTPALLCVWCTVEFT